jgi:hypothetical protein
LSAHLCFASLFSLCFGFWTLNWAYAELTRQDKRWADKTRQSRQTDTRKHNNRTQLNKHKRKLKKHKYNN